MSTYLLLRDHIQLGPYTHEELKAAGMRTTDLIWVKGISTAWRYPEEIEELKALVHFLSSTNLKTDEVSYTNNQIQPNKSSNDKIRNNGNDDNLPYEPQELNFQSFENKKKENELYEEEHPDTGETIVPFNIRYPDIKKYHITREGSPGSRPIEVPGIEIPENKTDISALPKIIKVIIADDHTLFREGVKMALSQKKDIKIVGEAENGMQLLHLLKHNFPDVILLDIQMPVMDGITALTSIRKSYSDLKVIMLSMYNDHSMVSTLMETGANAYLTKSADSESIYEAIKTCYSKSYYFNDLTNMSMLERIRTIKQIPEKPAVPKTENFYQVVKRPDLQEKPNRPGLFKIKKKLIIVTCSILLITSGILAGISILSHPNPIIHVLPKGPKQSKKPAAPVNLSQEAPSQSLQTDTVRKMNVSNTPPEEKTSPVQNVKNEKSIATPILPMVSSIDSNGNQYNIHSTKKHLSENTDKKAMARAHLRTLVTAYANYYRIKTPDEFSNIKLTIYNQTYFTLDQVNVEVKYLLSDSTLYKKETMNFKKIPPLSSKVMRVPSSSMGVRIECRIISVKSKELDL